MKPGIPWSVKGIESQARERAKEAAHRAGMTLGAWLNTVILERAEDADVTLARQAGRTRQAMPEEEVKSRLDDLAAQIAELNQRGEEAAGPSQFESARPSRNFNQILERIDNTERQTAEALAAVNERLVNLGQELAQPVPPRLFVRPEDVPGFPALEGALRNIVEHIAASETRSRDALKSMQDRLAEIGSRSAGSDDEATISKSPIVERFEERLTDMGTRVARAEASVRQSVPQAVTAELAKLNERIEAVRLSSDAQAARARQVASQAVHEEFRDFRNTGADDQRVRTEIEGLSQRIDDLKADAASERDLHSLRVAVEQISARLAQIPILPPLAEVDRRLAELADRLERSRAGDHHLEPQVSDLESRIAGLDHRLSQIVSEPGEMQAWSAVQPQLAALIDRLGHTEERLEHLASLDRSIGQLFDSVEQTRNWARDVAEDAANRMASRVVEAQPGASATPSAELRAMTEALATLRTGATSTDQRNQETFAAIHDTLEQIVGRLADIEMAITGTATSQPPLESPSSPGRLVSEMPILAPAPGSMSFEPPRIPPIESFAPHPAEANLSPLVAPLPDPPSPAEINTAPADDFIAAARRAAHAAAKGNPFGNGMTFLNRARAKSTNSPSSSKFSIPFLRRESPPAGPPTDLPPAAALTHHGRRRTLILAGLVLLAAISAITLRSLWSSRDITPLPKPPASESEIVPGTDDHQTTGMNVAAGSTAANAIKITNYTDEALTAALPVPSDVDSAAGDTSVAGLPLQIGSASLRQAALGGNAEAQYAVANRYLEGQDVKQDASLAAKWYLKAAVQDFAPAQYRLGSLYERGKGVTQNLATALEWYERAAKGGNVKAMHNAAVIYAGAQAGAPGYDKAVHWFEQAAWYGLDDSQYNLAMLYERGVGVEKDLAKALFWYSLAARQNDPDAAAHAKALAAKLDPDVIAQVQSRAETFQPRPLDAAANGGIDAAGHSPSAAAELPGSSTLN